MEISQQAHDIMTIIQIFGYPLILWLGWRWGFEDGIAHTLNFLEEKGLMKFDENPEEEI